LFIFSTSFDKVDFPKKIKEYDDKINYYTREKQKLIKILASINKDFRESSLLANTNNQTISTDTKSKPKIDGVKELEEKLETVVDKYNCLSMKYDIKFNDYENLKVSHREIREKCYNFKNKFESLLKVNNELKDKLIEKEKEHLLQQEEFKSLVKKNSFIIKKIEVILY
jgi:chromosome segregation ATPase